jgi:hypothetical protein
MLVPRERGVHFILILDLGARWSGQRHAAAALPSRKDTRCPFWIGGSMGLRAGLDTEARGKILCLCRESKPGRPVSSQALS